MTKRYRFLLYFFSALCFAWSGGKEDVLAQLSSVHYHRDNFSYNLGNNAITLPIVPFFLNSFNLEYDRAINEKHWIKVSPSLITKMDLGDKNARSIQKMLGFSIGVYHRFYYCHFQEKDLSLFLQWGIAYKRNSIEEKNLWTTKVNQYGLDLALGLRQIIARPLFLDFFIGYGQRWTDKIETSHPDPAESVATSFDRHIFDHAYSGPTLVLGLNIGIIF